MKKIILILITIFLLLGCQIKKQSGEMVMMPSGYTVEQTNQFLRSILTQNFRESIDKEFPEFSRFEKGGFRYTAVKTKSFTGNGSGVGVILKTYDLEEWDKLEEFKKYLLYHLKNELKNPTSLNKSSEPVVSIEKNSSGETITSIRDGNKTKIMSLDNGKKVKLLSMEPYTFKNGDPPALVLRYETEIPLSDNLALKAEVDEIWKQFRHNVEKGGYTTAAIRAQKASNGKGVEGYGFVILKQPDGSWKHLE